MTCIKEHNRIPMFLLLIMIFTVFISFIETANAQGTDNENGRALPQVSLSHRMRGEEAVRALGAKLPEVASWHRMSADKLKELLLRDKTLWVDTKGRLLYIDEFEAPQEAEDTASAAAEVALPLAPLTETFYLHSKPQAKKVIYLDFNGHLIPSNSAWASYNSGQAIQAPPWDTDGNPQVFGTSELQAIQYIWQRVAEDYAPFDVDVTTEELTEDRITRSGSADEYYGMRALISPISSYIGNYGGVAYVGVFDDVGDYYKPALIFSDKMYGSDKYTAECVSHEVGHTLGLYHDGTTQGVEYYQGHGSGEIGWAPIMGVAYYQNLTQWSKGEYPLANNTEDDLARIQVFGGFGYTADDHGNDLSGATWLSSQAGAISVKGIIEKNTDIDMFAFAAGTGQISITVVPAQRGPNLDTLLRLYNDQGVLVASSDTSLAALGASILATVAEGVYYISVDGVGNINASDYDSLGEYTVSGTIVTPGNPLPPVARASASPTKGKIPVTVQFSASGSIDPDGVIVSYLWDFADGGYSNEIVPAPRTYGNAGTYDVQLTVTDNMGLADTAVVRIEALPPNVPPVAVIQATPTEGIAPLVVSLNAGQSYDSDGSIVQYSWKFGDGSTGSGTALYHTYQNPGVYTVELTVTDDNAATDTTRAVITATQDPNAISAPANLSALVSGNAANLTWRDNSLNEEGFYVERGIKAKGTTTYLRIAALPAGATAYADPNLAGGTYYYRVQAFNKTTGRVSAYSNVATATIAKGGGKPRR